MEKACEKCGGELKIRHDFNVNNIFFMAAYVLSLLFVLLFTLRLGGWVGLVALFVVITPIGIFLDRYFSKSLICSKCGSKFLLTQQDDK